MANTFVRDATGAQQRLDDVLGSRLAVVAGADPGPAVIQACREEGVLLVVVHGDDSTVMRGSPDASRVDVSVDRAVDALSPFVRNRNLAVVVRPDGVVGAVGRARPPAVPHVLPAKTTLLSPGLSPEAVSAR